MSKARELFDRELTGLRDNILHLAEMTEVAIKLAVQALKDQDKNLAHRVIADAGHIYVHRQVQGTQFLNHEHAGTKTARVR